MDASMIIKGISLAREVITENQRVALIEKIRATILHDESSNYHYGNSAGAQLEGLDEIYNSLTEKIRKETGLRVIKANAYGRIYKNNSVLKPHKDREGLDLTLSIQLKNDFGKTPLYAENYDGTISEALLENRDGLFIKGRELTHWRNEIKGKDTDELICVFFHWTIVGIEKIEIENFLTDEMCDEIISEDSHYTDSLVLIDGRGQVAPEIRSNKVAFYVGKYSKLVDDKILELCGDLKLEGLQLLKYDKGAKFSRHCDDKYEGSNGYKRLFTAIVYLNDDCDGGQTHFNRVGFTAQPKKGKLLIWKNLGTNGELNQLTEHESLPIVSGQKFGLVNWLLIK